jgi:ADP-glucose pyrophosphorylase
MAPKYLDGNTKICPMAAIVQEAVHWTQRYIESNTEWSNQEQHSFSTILSRDLPIDAWSEWYQGTDS